MLFSILFNTDAILFFPVYKALYETTKLAVKDRNVHPVRDTGMECVPPKVSSKQSERVAASKNRLAFRSAAMVTSQCGLRPSKCHCHQDIRNKQQEQAQVEYVFAYDTPQSSDLDASLNTNYHARVLDIPSYCEKDVVEEHVKSELIGSCRYYSNLLTKHFGFLKEKGSSESLYAEHRPMSLSIINNKTSVVHRGLHYEAQRSQRERLSNVQEPENYQLR
ncbi:unnamed protein product [Diatraea saccharalis]|uniref:Uncharacterized protein n=1 Tax=Diatraea saccharalis TaxID=40085 RepID=A0A9P0G0X6_9NEOP|nr:unnamed protein product [Diatraea saccharalis]